MSVKIEFIQVESSHYNELLRVANVIVQAATENDNTAIILDVSTITNEQLKEVSASLKILLDTDSSTTASFVARLHAMAIIVKGHMTHFMVKREIKPFCKMGLAVKAFICQDKAKAWVVKNSVPGDGVGN